MNESNLEETFSFVHQTNGIQDDLFNPNITIVQMDSTSEACRKLFYFSLKKP